MWEAENETGERVALKVLLRVDPRSEPYRRFRDEISALREVSDLPGVLGIIDFSLPDEPSRELSAWLAMPIATPIRKALEEAPLGAVVGAVASVAATLALLAERNISHRDIKPENLYRLDDHWAVGDFGLVEFPNKEDLTAENRKLGPTYYLAPEMLRNASAANAGPADVYSLAKTLWVLAAGQNYPPPGELRTDRAGSRVSDVVAHPRSYLLDRLLEQATADDPEVRPSMADMAAELRAWLAAPRGPAATPDLTELAARVASTLGPGLREERMREEYRRSAIAAFQRMYDAVRKFPALFLAPVGLTGAVALGGQSFLEGHLVRGSVTTPTGETMMWESEATLSVTAPHPRKGSLWCAVGAKAFDDGSLDLAGALLLGRYHFPQEDVWSLVRTVNAGSAQDELTVADVIAGLEENLPRALEAFLNMVAEA